MFLLAPPDLPSMRSIDLGRVGRLVFPDEGLRPFAPGFPILSFPELPADIVPAARTACPLFFSPPRPRWPRRMLARWLCFDSHHYPFASFLSSLALLPEWRDASELLAESVPTCN